MLLRIIMVAVIILVCVQRSAGQAGVKGAKNTMNAKKSGFDVQKTLRHRNNQDSAIILYVKLLVVIYLR